MSDMIKRQKIVERDYLDWDTKHLIAKKSDDRCCHCGKKCYIGYGATVEHFIPISKGGTNRDINLIMLCEKCNKDKSNLIVHPKYYLKYLSKEHLDKLYGYFWSYVQSFEYIERSNILACDIYDFDYYLPTTGHKLKGKRNSYTNTPVLHVRLKRAFEADVERIHEYFVKYLTKYDYLDSPETAMANIQLWMKYGCIYYYEGTDGEIKLMFTVTSKKCKDETVEEYGVVRDFSIFMFPYYSTRTVVSLLVDIYELFPTFIMTEQNVDALSYSMHFLSNDSAMSKMVVMHDLKVDGSDEFVSSVGTIRYDADSGVQHDRPADSESYMRLCSKFKDISDEEISDYMKSIAPNGDTETIEWMKDYVG